MKADGSWPAVLLDGQIQTGPRPAMERLLGIEFEKLRSGRPIDLSDVHDLKEVWSWFALLRDMGASAPTEADRTACDVIVQCFRAVVSECMDRFSVDPTPVIVGIDYPNGTHAQATWSRFEGKVLASAGSQTKDPGRGDGETGVAKAIEALLPPDGEEVLRIAQLGQSADYRMRAICRVDPGKYLFCARRSGRNFSTSPPRPFAAVTSGGWS